MLSTCRPMRVIRQQKWNDEELVARGFRYFPRKKQLVMARELPASEAPKTIVTAWDSLVAQAGTMICYEPGDVVWPGLDDYFHWPVEKDIFGKTYRPWDEPNWTPTGAEAHLMSLGCKPYYKYVGVWAKQLTEETVIQSLESPEPVNVPPGAWVSIGVEGEPYALSDRSFNSRYDADLNSSSTIIKRLIRYLRGKRK
jgi:hypothetical protein